ncbi:MAG: hypothetical protein ACRD3T_01120 [Terriglobia bacterium]
MARFFTNTWAPRLGLPDAKGYSADIERAGLATPATGGRYGTGAGSIVMLGKDQKVI